MQTTVFALEWMLNDVETGFYVSQCKMVLIFVPNQMNICWVLIPMSYNILIKPAQDLNHICYFDLLSFDGFSFGEEKFSWLPSTNRVADENLHFQRHTNFLFKLQCSVLELWNSFFSSATDFSSPKNGQIKNGQLCFLINVSYFSVMLQY